MSDNPLQSSVAKSDEEHYRDWLKTTYFRTPEYYGNEHSITVEDFLNISLTGLQGPKSWLTDASIDVPLTLLTQKKWKQGDQGNLLLVSTGAAAALCAIGLGSLPNDYVLEAHPVLCAAMKAEKVRWVLVPCCDGFSAQYDFEKEQEGREDANLESHLKNNHGGSGSHWGLLVIDNQKDKAYWLDGHLTLGRKQRTGPWYIRFMCPAGQAAGNVLSGYERVMERPLGQFDARTLKFVPNDYEHNRFSFDGGSACGPWTFAMLQYIFRHPQYLEDLYTTFHRTRQEGHVNALDFNSKQVRREMQEIIKSHDQAQSLPYMLNTAILRLLDLPSLDDLLVAYQRHENIFLSPVREDRSIRHFPENHNNEDDDDESDHSSDDDDELEAHGGVEQSESDLVDLIGGDPEFFTGLNDAELWIQAREMLPFKQYAIEQQTSIQHQDYRQDWPMGVTELPDFAHIPLEDLAAWKDMNPNLFADLEPEHSIETERALLHKKFKKTFAGETARTLKQVWARTNAFSKYSNIDSLSPKTILYNLMKKYEPEVLIRLSKMNGRNRSSEKSSAFKGPGRTLAESKSGHSASEKTEVGGKPGTKSDPRRAGKMDYRTMTPREIMKEVEKYPEVKNHQAIKELKNTHYNTFRAILFVEKQKGTFKKENARQCELWVKDPNVFVQGIDYILHRPTGTELDQLKLLISVKEVRARMFDTYEKKEMTESDSPGTATTSTSRESTGSTSRRSPRTKKNQLTGKDTSAAPSLKQPTSTKAAGGSPKTKKRKTDTNDDEGGRNKERPRKKTRVQASATAPSSTRTTSTTVTAPSKSDPKRWFLKSSTKPALVTSTFNSRGLSQHPSILSRTAQGRHINEFTMRNLLFRSEGGSFDTLTLQTMTRICVKDSLIFDEGTDWMPAEQGSTTVACPIRREGVLTRVLEAYGDGDLWEGVSTQQNQQQPEQGEEEEEEEQTEQ